MEETKDDEKMEGIDDADEKEEAEIATPTKKDHKKKKGKKGKKKGRRPNPVVKPIPPPMVTTVDEDGNIIYPWPDHSSLNVRLRKCITNFQRHYKKRMLKNEQIQRVS